MTQEQMAAESGKAGLMQKAQAVQQESAAIDQLSTYYRDSVLSAVEQNEAQYRQAHEEKRKKMLQIAVMLLVIGIAVIFSGIYFLSALFLVSALVFFAQAEELKAYEPKEEYTEFMKKYR